MGNETDRISLLEFKSKIATDRYGILSSWNDSVNFCKWHGITCSSKHHRVASLKLQGMSLSGTISPYIGNLTFLRFLNLADNRFYGEIPQEVGRLFRLRLLNLSDNTLRGEIPINISFCSELRIMSLAFNSLVGKIPAELGSLKKLVTLFLSSNNLTGKIPHSNQLQGKLPANIGLTLPNLQIFEIGMNQFHGSIPVSWTNASVQLEIFDIYANSFTGQVPRKGVKNPASNRFILEKLLRISYKELLQATQGFSSDNLIGQGSFGSVYRGSLDLQGERIVAVKVLDLQQQGASKSFIAECRALRHIRHRNLVKILTYCSSIDFKGNDFKALVLDFMANGSLEMWLHPKEDGISQSRNLNFLQRLHVAIDLSSAMHYLHDLCETPIIHCDLKPNNILLDSDMTAHVGDFGLARLLSKTADNSSQGQTSSIGIKGTIGYMPPEYGIGSEATTYGDVYSFGIILLEIFTGRRPTDEVFTDGLNLHNFVSSKLPGQVMQLLDSKLIATGDVRAEEIVEDNESDDGQNEIQENNVNIENLKLQGSNVQKCVVSVLKIGLACSAELPGDRMNMSDVTRKLNIITEAFARARTR
ncbi:putative receptor-like protein kinase At3g47110 [Hevea brasiliensis]|uniref:putative receptor-like protein kinase At3g47110 n=1 Tax=Hevea brasiliensis TaxID=3981 RepID=UPI0025D2B2D3|nr:putative receptor-like protein kinase At3g47110 [Hevea brasiliensis]